MIALIFNHGHYQALVVCSIGLKVGLKIFSSFKLLYRQKQEGLPRLSSIKVSDNKLD